MTSKREDELDVCANDFFGLQDAVARALEDRPELAAELDESVVKLATAAAEKERGNDAFKAKDFASALKHFTAAIAADNTNSILYSNRWDPENCLVMHLKVKET